MKNLLFTTLFMTCSFSVLSAEVAKVIILKGDADLKDKNGKILGKLNSNQSVEEGMTIQTKARSFVKLMFIDKSQMSLGPDSEMKIDQFPKDKAGVIDLVKGQLRSKVTKDYMSNDDKDKSKLFIKTQTAAMGVRGTDFQVNFNEENKATALITFEGAVAMAKLDESFDPRKLNNSSLEAVVSSPSAVIVTKGQYSGAGPEMQRATIPTKINPAQLDSLKKNEGDKSNEAKNEGTETKVFRSPIPPGVSTKEFVNNSKELDKAVAQTVTSDDGKKAMNEKQADSQSPSWAAKTVAPPAEGYVNKATGEVAPTAGGFIDPKTALYVPPPKGSIFDSNTGTYQVPASMGGFDAKSGTYVPPKGLELTAKGEFVVKVEAPKETAKINDRAPASTENKPAQPAQGANQAPPMVVLKLNPMNMDTKNFDQAPAAPVNSPGVPMLGINGANGMPQSPGINAASESALKDVQTQVQQTIQNNLNNQIIQNANGTTKLNVIIN